MGVVWMRERGRRSTLSRALAVSTNSVNGPACVVSSPDMAAGGGLPAARALHDYPSGAQSRVSLGRGASDGGE